MIAFMLCFVIALFIGCLERSKATEKQRNRAIRLAACNLIGFFGFTTVLWMRFQYGYLV